jgi:hypothetical protein
MIEDGVDLEIIEASDDLLWVRALGPWGMVELVGTLRMEAGTMYLDGVHMDGAWSGRLGRRGLNAIARKILEESGADKIVLQGSIRTSGRKPGRAPRAFRFPNPKRFA